jgi:hypothetical protein
MSETFQSQLEIVYPVRVEREHSLLDFKSFPEMYESYMLRGANGYPLASNMAKVHAEEIARILNWNANPHTET